MELTSTKALVVNRLKSGNIEADGIEEIGRRLSAVTRDSAGLHGFAFRLRLLEAASVRRR